MKEIRNMNKILQ